MLNSKQRSKLKALAQTEEPIGQIGKGGISDNMVKSLADALEARELIKLSVLNNSEDEPIWLARELEGKLGAECVAVIGKKIILYKKSLKKAKEKKGIKLD